MGNVMKTSLCTVLLVALLLLASSCSRSELEIVAETYPPEVGPVIPAPSPGGPVELSWFTEPAIGISSVDGQWVYSSVGVASANDNQPGAVMVALAPRDGELLRCVRVALIGPSGHQKTPEHPAAVSVWQIDLDTGSPEQLAVTVDDASKLDVYEHVHQLEACTAKDKAVDLGRYRYQASVFNESGFNSLPGVELLGVRRGVAAAP